MSFGGGGGVGADWFWMSSWMKEGMVYGDLPFPGNGGLVLGIGNDYCRHHLQWHDWCSGHCFYIHLPLGCFFPRRIFFSNGPTRNIFIYLIKNNHQECSMFDNGLYLLCLGTWMDHLPHILWSTLRLFSKWQLVCTWVIADRFSIKF